MQTEKIRCQMTPGIIIYKTAQSGLRTGLLIMALVASLLPGSALYAQVLMQNRITSPIRADQMQIMQGTVHPLIASAQDEGRLSGSTVIPRMSLVFKLSPAQETDLKKLLAAQQTKGSPMYHRWLKPGEFAARYGVSQQDLAKVAAWLQSQGFHVDAIPPSADRIDFTGTAAQVETVFQTQIHRYLLHGVQGWANSTEISLPHAIASMSLGIRHLNTFRPQPQLQKTPVRVSHGQVNAVKTNYNTARSNYTVQTQNGTLNFLAPADIHTIYNVKGLYNNSITGTGQTMAVAGQTDIVQYQSDISRFRSLSGLNPNNMPKQILVPNSGSAQAYPSDLEEADLDVEWSGAMAKDATILYITVGNNQNYGVFDSLQYAIQTPLINNTQYVPVVSISYGNCEAAFAGTTDIASLEQMFQQANAQGQTIVAAAGDSGSAGCDQTGQNSSGQYVGATGGLAAEYPASSQYVTGAGGTSFSGDVSNQSQYWSQTNSSNNGSALSYIPETTWNDTRTIAELKSFGSLSAGSGGASSCATSGGTSTSPTCTGGFPKPSWQTGPGVPSDGVRDVPDISLAGDANHDGYVLCTEETTGSGSSETFSGTSSCVYPVGANEAAYFDANGSGYLYGGTSVVAPELSGMITLWNQEAGNSKGIGNANPVFYVAAKNNPGAFHDVLTGNNAVVCQQGSPDCVPDPNVSGNYVMSCCDAGSGYDMATGLGSIDATAMGAIWPSVTAVNGSFSLLVSPHVLSVKPGSSVNTTVVLSPNNGFTGAVALACSNLPAGVSCSFSPNASVNIASGSQQNIALTINATSSARLLSPLPRGLERQWPMDTAFASVLGVFLLGAARKRRLLPARWVSGRSSRWLVIWGLMFGFIAATSLIACSGSKSSSLSGGSGTGSGTGTGSGAGAGAAITVTGTSGTTTASTQISLTIQ